MSQDKEIPEPPSAVFGRRARRIWRDLAPICAQKGALNEASAVLLTFIANKVAAFEENPEDFDVNEWRELREIAKPLGICL